MATATRYACLYKPSLHCDHGDGKPRRSKCGYCGSPLHIETGLWGVFTWRGDNRYPEADAHRTFARKSAADKWAHERELVVRWIYT